MDEHWNALQKKRNKGLLPATPIHYNPRYNPRDICVCLISHLLNKYRFVDGVVFMILSYISPEEMSDDIKVSSYEFVKGRYLRDIMRPKHNKQVEDARLETLKPPRVLEESKMLDMEFALDELEIPNVSKNALEESSVPNTNGVLVVPEIPKVSKKVRPSMHGTLRPPGTVRVRVRARKPRVIIDF